MLDSDIREQLITVFKPLEGDIVLRYQETAHEAQSQLVDLLADVSETSPKISVSTSPAATAGNSVPTFWIEHNGKKNGVVFRGIPGGHEFTSLILAILNSDGKGKVPDAQIVERIRRIKGPVRLRTYISLTCETCPDIVQALNQMAILHPDFEHTMIDGAYVQDEVNELGLQGVPSVIEGSRLLHSGRTTFIDLLNKLEETFGSESSAPKVQNLGHFDVVVVGGGPAGASAAIYAVRKGLKTALIAEKFGGQVQDTKGIENLISVTYTEGPQWAAQLNQHLAQYPVQMFEHRRVKEISKGATKTISLEGGEYLSAAAVVVTTGAKWRELGVPGEKEYIGRGVAFCPHCDGPYYKGKNIAVVGGGNSGVEAAIDLAGIAREVVLLEFASELKADQVLIDKLKSLPNASIVLNAKTEKVVGDGQKVIGLEYQNRKSEKIERIDLDGVFVQIGLLPNSGFLKGVVELTKFGEIVVDGKGRTSEPGIYAAGDVTTTPYKQIVIAIGEGAKAALALFEDRMKQSA